MSLLNRLESRFGRWAVPNLTALLIGGQAALFGASLLRGREAGGLIASKVALWPSQILEGEVWRLVTFPFMPPQSPIIFALISWMLLYLFGNALEQSWGAFRYNVYLLIAYVANIAAAFAVYAVWGAQQFGFQPLGMAGVGSNALLYGGVFFAFVRLFPDMVINLFFVLPIRIKWLGLLGWIGVGYGILTGSGAERLLLVGMIINYLVYFGRDHVREWRQGQRRRAFETKVKQAALPRHECQVCGLNSVDSPKTLFRYCSKCAGQQCYCPDHIRDHEHVTEDATASSPR
jgi:hypothetical protein